MKLASVLLFAAVALAQTASGTFTQETLKGYLENGADFDFILIDVRTRNEIRAAIGNAPCKPYNFAWPEQFQQEVANIPKDRNIIVYCQSGGRSKLAADYLKANGFTNVFDAGGYRTWKGPTVTPFEIKSASLIPEPACGTKAASLSGCKR